MPGDGRRQQLGESKLQRALAVDPALELARSGIRARPQRCAEGCGAGESSFDRFTERSLARRPLMHQSSPNEGATKSTIPDRDRRWQRQQLFNEQGIVGQLVIDRVTNRRYMTQMPEPLLLTAHNAECKLRCCQRASARAEEQ